MGNRFQRDCGSERRGITRVQLVVGLAVLALALLLGGRAVLGPRASPALEAVGMEAKGAEEPTLRSGGGPLPTARDASLDVERSLATAAATSGEEPRGAEEQEDAPDPRSPKLTVRVLDTLGVSASGVMVELTASPLAQDQAPHLSREADLEGRVTLLPPRAVPLRLSVFGRINCNLLLERDLAAFEEGESREVEFVLPIVLRKLVLRIVDALGEPVSGATVALAGDGFRGSLSTRGGELLNCGAVECDKISLGVIAPGFAPLVQSGIPVPTDGSPIEFVMLRGVSLRVEVVDQDGRPVADVFINVRSQGLGHSGTSPRPGVFDINDLPDRELELVALVGGREYERRVHPAVGRIEVVVPVHGQLDVDWKKPEPWETRQALLTLQPIEPVFRDTSAQNRMLEGQSGRVHFGAVLPGRHRVLFQPYPGDPRPDVEVEPQEVEIEARRTATVAL